MSSLADCPDEIIRHVLDYVPPEDNLQSVQLLSGRFRSIANEPLLWKGHCLGSFCFWSSEHKLHEKLAARAPDVEWKKLWVAKKSRSTRVARLLDGIIATKVGQLKKIQQICLLGYDAKDYLLAQCYANEFGEDNLARR